MKEEAKQIMMRTRHLKNRRICMGRLPDGDFYLVFKILDKEAMKGQRVRVTTLRLSPDAMDSVVALYMVEVGL